MQRNTKQNKINNIYNVEDSKVLSSGVRKKRGCIILDFKVYSGKHELSTLSKDIQKELFSWYLNFAHITKMGFWKATKKLH